MAKLPAMPPPSARLRMRGVLQAVPDRGIIVLKRWPRKRGPGATPAQRRARDEFAALAILVASLPEDQKEALKRIVRGTGWTWRDAASQLITGRFVQFTDFPYMAIQKDLDAIENTVGAMLIRVADGWIGLLPGDLGKWLRVDPATGLPDWQDIPPGIMPTLNLRGRISAGDGPVENLTVAEVRALLGVEDDTGITRLHGDVIAGPGDGDQLATLASTAVVPGTYSRATITVDAKGRLTAASTGAADAGITQLHGDVTAGPGDGDQAASIVDHSVTNAKLAQVPASTFKGNHTAATANAEDMTAAQAASLVQPYISGAGGGIGGLYSGVMSATVPTSASTGLTNWQNQGTATVTDTPVGVTIFKASEGANANYRSRYKLAPATPYTITALVALNSILTNFQTVGIGWSDGTKLHIVALQSAGLKFVVARFSDANTFVSSDVTGSAGLPPFIWLQIADDGTTIAFRYSTDGYRFVTLYSIAKSSGYLGATGYSRVIFTMSAYGADAYATLMSWSQL